MPDVTGTGTGAASNTNGSAVSQSTFAKALHIVSSESIHLSDEELKTAVRLVKNPNNARFIVLLGSSPTSSTQIRAWLKTTIDPCPDKASHKTTANPAPAEASHNASQENAVRDEVQRAALMYGGLHGFVLVLILALGVNVGAGKGIGGMWPVPILTIMAWHCQKIWNEPDKKERTEVRGEVEAPQLTPVQEEAPEAGDLDAEVAEEVRRREEEEVKKREEEENRKRYDETRTTVCIITPQEVAKPIGLGLGQSTAITAEFKLASTISDIVCMVDQKCRKYPKGIRFRLIEDRSNSLGVYAGKHWTLRPGFVITDTDATIGSFLDGKPSYYRLWLYAEYISTLDDQKESCKSPNNSNHLCLHVKAYKHGATPSNHFIYKGNIRLRKNTPCTGLESELRKRGMFDTGTVKVYLVSRLSATSTAAIH